MPASPTLGCCGACRAGVHTDCGGQCQTWFPGHVNGGWSHRKLTPCACDQFGHLEVAFLRQPLALEPPWDLLVRAARANTEQQTAVEALDHLTALVDNPDRLLTCAAVEAYLLAILEGLAGPDLTDLTDQIRRRLTVRPIGAVR